MVVIVLKKSQETCLEGTWIRREGLLLFGENVADTLELSALVEKDQSEISGDIC